MTLTELLRGTGRHYWRPALAFHGLMLLLGLALFTPAATMIGNVLERASGTPVVSNFDIVGFMLSGRGIAFVLVLALLSVGLLLAEFAGLTWIAVQCQLGGHVSALSAAAQVVRRLPALLRLTGRVLLRLAALAVPFLALAALVALTLLGNHDINFYLAEQPAEWRWTVVAVAALGLAYGLITAAWLLRWSFAIPFVLEGRAVRGVLGESSRIAGALERRLVLPLLLWWGGLAAVALLVGWLGRSVADAAYDVAGADLGRVLLVTALCLAATLLTGFAISGFQLAGHQFLVSGAYLQASATVRPAPVPVAEEAAVVRRARPLLLALLVLVVASIGVVALETTRIDPGVEVGITAHRGAAAHAPENSLAAFRFAMEQGATHAELDVQRARDGTLIVLHDADFMRMAGVPRRVATLTKAEIAAIDIGSKRGAAFARERVPTLSEVITLVRGHMQLNVELKYNVRDPQLAPAVVELLRREDFIDQALVSSLNAAALQQVRRLEPRLRTGLIVTAALGPVARADVDFLSLNAARVTPAVLRRARAAGKQVHVWTVNKPDVMLLMIEHGVDNIITDDPALLARVLREREALEDAERLALRLRVLFDRAPREITDPAAVPLQ